LASPLRRLAETLAAGLVPGAGGAGMMEVDDDRTVAADADRTAFAGDDDRTMLAPPMPPRPAPAPPAGTRAPQPVMVPPRRRQVEAERSGVHPIVWVLLLAVMALGAFIAWQQTSGRREPGPVAADTMRVDSAKQDTIDNTDALALSMEGLRFMESGDPAMALDFFRRANAIDPRNPEYRDQMAVAMMQLGRHAEAAQLLETTIRIDRRYDLLYSHLGEARLALGDTVSAMRAIEEFIELTQDAEDRAQAVALLTRLRTAAQPPPIQPVPGPTDTTPSITPPVDTFRPPPRPGAPRDTLRFPR
ncbi:MAG TPA: tetratricopeptide repeat protein, partial [Longimicrobium sp.]|nr:tetratricopeptide repeat protein [Longimicrobium sp.]